MNTRTKRIVRTLLSAVLVLVMTFQSLATPLNYAKPAVTSEPAKVTGAWSQDTAGNWSFRSQDGAAKDGWYYLNTGNHSAEYNWFCFDVNGVMRTGWIPDKSDPSVWYYTGESKDGSEGGLVKGWITDPQDGKRYYLDPSTGIMCHGWKQISGVWYYFGESQYADRRWGQDSTGYWTDGKSGKHTYGALYMNEYTPDGYYVGSNGAWIPNYSKNEPRGPIVVSVTGVSLDLKALTLDVGNAYTLKAAVVPANATNKNVTWKSSDESIAAVDTAGKVTAVAAGTAIITVTTVDGARTASCTVTVKAAPTPVTYTVTFDMQGHGTQIDPLSNVVFGSKISAPTAPTAEGYTFGGWCKEEACTTEWKFDTDTVSANTTLYAKWTENTYNIIVEDDGNGTASANLTSAAPGTTVTLTATPADGYAFKEWEIARGLEEGAITDNSFTMPSKEVKVKAIFERVYNINLQTNEHGTVTAKVGGETATTAVADAEVTLTATPAEGYKFKEWEVVSGGVTVTENKFTMPASNVTVKVIFEEIPTVVPVTSVSIEPSSIELPVGEEQTLSATVLPENATNKNVTWSSDNTDVATVDATGKVTAVAAGEATITVTTVDGNKTATCTVTVTATPTTYTVTYDANNATSGNIPTAQTKTEDEDLTLAANTGNLANSVYRFAGWNTAADGSGTHYDERATYKTNADLKLYAEWAEYNTIADVLATAEGGFPEGNELKESPENAWVGAEKQFAYAYKYNGEAIALNFYNATGYQKYIVLSTGVTAEESCYTATTTNNSKLTFKMTNGKLTSIVFYSTEDVTGERFNGTYAPAAPAKLTKMAPPNFDEQVDETIATETEGDEPVTEESAPVAESAKFEEKKTVNTIQPAEDEGIGEGVEAEKNVNIPAEALETEIPKAAIPEVADEKKPEEAL